MLTDLKNKIKPFENDLVIAAVIILVALIGFGLGRLSVLLENKKPIVVENMPAAAGQTELETPFPSENGNRVSNSKEGLLVGSKNSDKYHFPWCPGAQRISEENKIWFSSKEEAEKAGYSPAGNCKGL